MTEAKDHKTYENDNIALSVDFLPECLVRFDVTTKPLATEAAKDKALKEIAKAVNIPGFRKGKAPKDLLLKQYKSQIEREEKEIITRNALSEAVLLTKIHPLNDQTKIHLNKCEPVDGGQYHISFEFESFPKVPSIDFAALKMQRPQPLPVSESDLEERVEELRLFHATFEEIKDRDVQENDFVTIDMDIIDGTPQVVYRDRRLKMSEKGLPNWAKKLVIGLKVGESAEGLSEQEEEKESKKPYEPKKCRITVKKIEIAHLPELDDALAKKAGVETVEELKKAIKVSLEKEQMGKMQNEMRKAVRKLLVDRYPFELPSSKIEKVKEETEGQALQEKEHFKSDEDFQEYKNLIFNEYLDSVKLSFLLPLLIREQNIPRPTVARLRERVMGYILSRQIDPQKLKQADLEYLMSIAENDLLTEDTLDFVIAKATENT